MTHDLIWQVSAMASLSIGVPVGFMLRRWVEQLDQRAQQQKREARR